MVLVYAVHADVCRVDDAVTRLPALRNGDVRMEVGRVAGARMIVYVEACEHNAEGQCVLLALGIQQYYPVGGPIFPQVHHALQGTAAGDGTADEYHHPGGM